MALYGYLVDMSLLDIFESCPEVFRASRPNVLSNVSLSVLFEVFYVFSKHGYAAISHTGLN